MVATKVSVVMAIYNGENYLYEQLDSIKNQTMQADEVIICDDCSKDSSAKIVNEFIKINGLQDSWKYNVNEHNLGYADNFHSGMKMTSGEFVFFCDQDDIWMPDKIEKMVKIMEAHSEIYTLASEYEPYYCTEDAPKISRSVTKKMVNDGTIELLKLSYNNIFINSEGCTMCIRRELLEMVDKYWYSGWPHDEFVWKMAEVIDGLYMYHSTTLKRRLHSNNVSKRKMHTLEKRIPFLENLLKSHEQMLLFASEYKLDKRYLKVIEDNIVSTKLRIELLKGKKLSNSITLAMKYGKCYHSKKAIPVELVMAIKGK